MISIEELLENKYVKEYGRLLAVLFVGIIIGLASLINHYSSVNSQYTSSGTMQPTSAISSHNSESSNVGTTPVSSGNTPPVSSATPTPVYSQSSLARQVYSWSSTYGIPLNITHMMQDIQTTQNLLSLNSPAITQADLPGDCSELSWDISKLSGIPAAPDPIIVTELSSAISIISNFTQGSCTDSNVLSSGLSSLSTAFTSISEDNLQFTPIQ